MARTVVVVSDLFGEAGAQTYRVTDGERVFEVDLTDREFGEYRAAVERFVQAGRPIAAGGADATSEAVLATSTRQIAE